MRANCIALVAAITACAGRQAIEPAPVPATAVRGDASAAARLDEEDQLAIYRTLIRTFFRPTGGQARWIDPRPLPHQRVADDSAVAPDPVWSSDIEAAIGLRRVCAIGANDEECAGRPGGVLRLSAPYLKDLDYVVVFARYAPVAKGARAVAGRSNGFEMEFHLARRGDGWKIVVHRTVGR